MDTVSLVLAVLFSLFSTSVMSYITLATPIGPWMGPTLVLVGTVLVRCFSGYISNQAMLLAVMSGSLGGILATAISFSFPTFYFLEPELFKALVVSPHQCIIVLFLLSLAAGLLGLWIAHSSRNSLIEKQNLPFPVGKLVYEVAMASDQKGKTKQLLAGFLGTLAYCFAQATAWFQSTIGTSPLVLIPRLQTGILKIPAIELDLGLMPMLWAIGFIAGHLMTIPLLVGALTRIFVTDLLQYRFFSYLSSSEFMLAFCSGMVLSGAATSLITTPKKMWQFFNKTGASKNKPLLKDILAFLQKPHVVLYLLFSFTVLSYFEFSWPAQFYLLVFTGICTYQIVVIAGKIGMALLGRFATFVMLPGLFLFGFNALQATVVATFVEMCGGIATEALFGLKTAKLADISNKKVLWFQIFGLVISSFVGAIVFWFLVTHFELGSAQLFAQRAQARALLVQAGNFDYMVVGIGVLFGFILKHFDMNPMLVLGGLLMSLSLTLGLVAGGLSTFLYKKKEELEPFCSGMYAANSLWMLLYALF